MCVCVREMSHFSLSLLLLYPPSSPSQISLSVKRGEKGCWTGGGGIGRVPPLWVSAKEFGGGEREKDGTAL